MVIQGSALLILSGLSAFVVGFLYGTVFGNVEWFRMITGLPGPLMVRTFRQHTAHAQVVDYDWSDSYHVGLLLDIFNKVYVKEYRELISGPLVWLWFYGAFGLTLLQYGLRFPNYLFDPRNTTDIFLRMGVPLIAMMGLEVLDRRIHGTDACLRESLLASLSHTISYVRILAMKLIDDVFLRLFLGVLCSSWLGVTLLERAWVGSLLSPNNCSDIDLGDGFRVHAVSSTSLGRVVPEILWRKRDSLQTVRRERTYTKVRTGIM